MGLPLPRAVGSAAVLAAVAAFVAPAGAAEAGNENGGAAAVPPAVEFEHVSLEEGVSHNLVYCILQDRTGFLWFGTMYGLVRWDGVRHVAYRHDPDDSGSLSYDDIVCLTEDAGGDLWVGTFGGGLNRLDRVTGRFDRFLGDGPDSLRLSSGIVWDLATDPAGGIWVATGNGLDRARGPQPGDEGGARPGARPVGRSGQRPGRRGEAVRDHGGP